MKKETKVWPEYDRYVFVDSGGSRKRFEYITTVRCLSKDGFFTKMIVRQSYIDTDHLDHFMSACEDAARARPKIDGYYFVRDNEATVDAYLNL